MYVYVQWMLFESHWYHGRAILRKIILQVDLILRTDFRRIIRLALQFVACFGSYQHVSYNERWYWQRGRVSLATTTGLGHTHTHHISISAVTFSCAAIGNIFSHSIKKMVHWERERFFPIQKFSLNSPFSMDGWTVKEVVALACEWSSNVGLPMRCEMSTRFLLLIQHTQLKTGAKLHTLHIFTWAGWGS